MADQLTIEIVTPRREVFVGTSRDITLSGVDGVMEIFPNHRPVLTQLRPGVLICDIDGVEKTFYVQGGYAEILPDRVLVLADEAELISDIDLDEANKRLEMAQAELEEHRLLPFDERKPYQRAVERAEARVRLAQQ